MKISDLIKSLQMKMAEHGDLDATEHYLMLLAQERVGNLA